MSNSTESNLDIFVENAAVFFDESPRKRCRPFILTVMVYSPESGYKFEVGVEKNCSSTNEALWGFSFKLYKKIENELVQLVEIVFKMLDIEASGIKKMAEEGATIEQFRAFKDDLYPVAKDLGEERRQPTSEEKEKIDSAIKVIVGSD